MRRDTGQTLHQWIIPLVVSTGLLAGAAIRWIGGRPDVAQTVWLVALLIGGAPLVFETVRGLWRGKFAADVVASLSIVTALGMGEYFAGLIIALMQSGGEALESYSLRRASSALEQLLARAPRVARRREGDHLREIPVEEVRPGDTLVLRPGDLVPVDGTLLSAHAAIDESALTGEPLTREKEQGERLLSGGVNRGDGAEMRAEVPAAASQYSKMIELVRRAEEEKPPFQRLADRYAVWFTPLTLGMSGLGWLITGDPRTILAVLVVATPCPLILAVPVAIIGGINRAAHAGIIVKGGAALEQLARARAIVFDKTGTLTYGAPTVTAIIPFAGFSETDLLRAAGGVEQLSSHPVGQAVAAFAVQRLGQLPPPQQVHEVPGRGVEAMFEGEQVLVGSPDLLATRLGQAAPPLPSTEPGLVVYVARAGRYLGVICLDDRLRPGVTQLVRRLHSLGVAHIAMLTGDNLVNAEAIAAQAGIVHVAAHLFPEDKVRRVRELGARFGSIAMVGDGINDAPALAAASVGIAMGASGTAISAEAADIVLLVDDVAKVGEAVAIGRRMLQIARQSVFIGLGLSFACMIVASFGLLPPAIGALIQEAIDVTVILNALRARGGPAISSAIAPVDTVPDLEPALTSEP